MSSDPAFSDFGESWGPSGAGIAQAQATAAGNVEAAQSAAAAQQYAAQQQTRQAQIQAQAQLAAAGVAAGASQFGSEKQYEAAIAPVQLKSNIFNTLLPYYSQAFGSVLGQQGGGLGGNVPTLQPPIGYGGGGGGGMAPPGMGGGGMGGGGMGGGGMGGGGGFALPPTPRLPNAPNLAPPQLPNAPHLPAYAPPSQSQLVQAPYMDPTSGSVISPQLLNQQINQGLAQNQQTAANQILQMQGSIGGRGVGASSPLADALSAQQRAAAIEANAGTITERINNAATLNANYAQAMNQAYVNQATGENTALIGANQGAYNAQLGALMSGYGTQVGALTNEYGTQADLAGATYGSQVNALTSMYGAQAGAMSQEYGAGLGAQASEYGNYASYLANIYQANISRQNALLQSLAGFANG